MTSPDGSVHQPKVSAAVPPRHALVSMMVEREGVLDRRRAQQGADRRRVGINVVGEPPARSAHDGGRGSRRRASCPCGPGPPGSATLTGVQKRSPPGEVVILNGTTSAGKTTLAVELQAQLAAAGECWLVWGIDDFLAKLPVAWLAYDDEGERADEGIRFDRVDGDITFRAGPIGDRLLASYRGTVAAMARNGLNVIVDEVVLDEAAWLDWVQCLEALPVLWVRVDCPSRSSKPASRTRRPPPGPGTVAASPRCAGTPPTTSWSTPPPPTRPHAPRGWRLRSATAARA